MNTLMRRTARLRAAGPHGIGRGSRLARSFSIASLNPSFHLAARLTTGFADGAAVEGLVEPYTDLVFGNSNESERPTFETNIVNGLPVIRFGGAHALLSDSQIAGSALFGADAATIYLVYKPDSTDADGQFRLVSWGAAGTNEVGFWGPFSDNNLYFDYGEIGGGGRVSGAQPGGFDDAFHVVELWRSGADAEITVDGALAVAGTMTDDLDTTALSGIVLCSGAKVDLAELVMVPRGLSASERDRTIAFLAGLYGLG